MPIVPKFNQADIKSRFDKLLEAVVKMQIKRLQLLGEECAIEARTRHTYTVQSGALISSTGYTVFVDGIAVKDDFEIIKEGLEGVDKGRDLCRKVALKYPQGVLRVVVAGMDYAIYLESKGYNVITSAELLAKKELPRMVAELKNTIKQAY